MSKKGKTIIVFLISLVGWYKLLWAGTSYGPIPNLIHMILMGPFNIIAILSLPTIISIIYYVKAGKKKQQPETTNDSDYPKVVSFVTPFGQKAFEGTAIGEREGVEDTALGDKYIKDGKWTHWYGMSGTISDEINYKNDKEHGLWTAWFTNGEKKSESTYEDGELISEVDFLKERIIELLKEKAIKMPVSDINAHLKFKDIDKIKEKCEWMYQNDDISFGGNGRYFILTEEEEKPKKTSAPKSEEVNVEKELEKLKGLLDKGLITQEQYDAKSNKLLGL